MGFDISDFSLVYFGFYVALGFLVSRMYYELPKKAWSIAHALVVFIIILIWHDTKDASWIWTMIGGLEAIAGAALERGCQMWKDR